MDKPVELIPLLCIRCSTPLPAGLDEVAWRCSQCGQGLLLNELSGLEALEVHFAAGIPASTPGRPFWVADAKVSLRRDTYEGNQGRDAEAFWRGLRRFFIPAFACPQETLLSLGSQLLLQPPTLTEGPPAPFLPVTFSPQDARSLAEFIVVAVEAARSDMLKELQFNLELGEPALWVLP